MGILANLDVTVLFTIKCDMSTFSLVRDQYCLLFDTLGLLSSPKCKQQ